jgi:hypothetical protein
MHVKSYHTYQLFGSWVLGEQKNNVNKCDYRPIELKRGRSLLVQIHLFHSNTTRLVSNGRFQILG